MGALTGAGSFGRQRREQRGGKLPRGPACQQGTQPLQIASQAPLPALPPLRLRDPRRPASLMSPRISRKKPPFHPHATAVRSRKLSNPPHAPFGGVIPDLSNDGARVCSTQAICMKLAWNGCVPHNFHPPMQQQHAAQGALP